MFEKFSNLHIDSNGSGGEYTVQAGFGWTNGVALWVTNVYGGLLDTPKCPNIAADAVSSEGNFDSSKSSGATSVVSATIHVVLAVVVYGVISW